LEAKFAVLQYVKISVHGLGYHGRVMRIIFDGGPQTIYGVNYICDGSLNNAEFFEDELEALVG